MRDYPSSSQLALILFLTDAEEGPVQWSPVLRFLKSATAINDLLDSIVPIMETRCACEVLAAWAERCTASSNAAPGMGPPRPLTDERDAYICTP